MPKSATADNQIPADQALPTAGQLDDDTELGETLKANDVKGKVKRCRMQTGDTKNSHYRSSLVSLCSDISSLALREDHLRQLERTPFWHLIDAVRDGRVKPDRCPRVNESMRKIIRCFNITTGKFHFGGHQLSITRKDAQTIFGIRDGFVPVDLPLVDWNKSDFYRACFSRDERPNRAALMRYITSRLDSLLPTYVKYVASLITLLVLCVFLLSTKNATINRSLEWYVNDLDKICDYDWYGLIVSELIDSVRKAREEKHVNAHGCVFLLCYWFCERSSVIEPVGVDTFPRVVKWDLTKLEQYMFDTDITGIKRSHRFIKIIRGNDHEKQALLVEQDAVAGANDDSKSVDEWAEENACLKKEIEGLNAAKDATEKELDLMRRRYNYVVEGIDDRTDTQVQSSPTFDTNVQLLEARLRIDIMSKMIDDLRAESERLTSEVSLKSVQVSDNDHVNSKIAKDAPLLNPVSEPALMVYTSRALRSKAKRGEVGVKESRKAKYMSNDAAEMVQAPYVELDKSSAVYNVLRPSRWKQLDELLASETGP